MISASPRSAPQRYAAPRTAAHRYAQSLSHTEFCFAPRVATRNNAVPCNAVPCCASRRIAPNGTAQA